MPGSNGNGNRAPQDASGGASSAILKRDGPRVTIRDLDTAAYVFYRRVPVVDARQVSRTEHHVVFYDPGNTVEGLAVDFANHETALYADAMRRLKRILRRLPYPPRPVENAGVDRDTQR